jgi:hypothetical protein
MESTPTPELAPAVQARLRKLVGAGFRLVRIQHVERYLAAEKNGFVALLEPSQGKLSVFGQAGYLMGEGLGMLVEREGRRAFVWKKRSVEATPELIAEYKSFKAEIETLLGEEILG